MALWLKPTIVGSRTVVRCTQEQNGPMPPLRELPQSNCFITHGLKMDFKAYSSLCHLLLGILSHITFLALNGLVKTL
ncbi:hypothetical protein EXN66_Car021969 [Channa argus]|uniref:Uncharacterized protein n=1 Tax=Channa argus TaxID=215402 RepID=A0A6G1QUW0_CHAAH|nr:hypothetical protein EXN66_Car021969 [Channa argus]